MLSLQQLYSLRFWLGDRNHLVCVRQQIQMVTL